jgi:hypothetical protein
MKLCTLFLTAVMGFAACDGLGESATEAADVAGVDAVAPCDPQPIATLTGCPNTTAMPLNLLAQPVDFESLAVFVDGHLQPRDRWEPTNGGHTITLVGTTCDVGSTGAQHLVSVCLAE